MAVLGQNIAAMPEELAAFDHGSEAAVRSNKDPALLELDRHSQTDIQDFATGAFQPLNQRDIDSRDWLSLSHREQEMAIADMGSAEALSTFDIMHNPIMEELASRHATDALAFANDVMINLAQIERKQQIAQFVPTGFEGDDDESLPPDERRKKQAEQNMHNLAQAMSDIHEERMEQHRKELQKQWDEGNVNVSVGGVGLTSRQIDSILKMWSDPEKKKKLIDDFAKKQNIDPKEAKDKLTEAMRILEITKKHERGEKLTREEQELYLKKDDPQYAPAIELLKKAQEKEMALNKSTDAKSQNEILTRPASPVNDTGKGITDGYSDFPSAKKLEVKNNFENAVNATTEDSAPSPQPTHPSPTQLAMAANASMNF